jgi:hypothetical protein
MMAGRIDAFYAARAPAMGIAPDGIESEFRRLHYTRRMRPIPPRWRPC